MDARITANDILAQVRGLNLKADGEQASIADNYRQAAAVLAAIKDPAALRPMIGTVVPANPAELLQRDLVRVSLRLGGRVMLQHDVRRKALRTLGSRERMLQALAANPAERTGPVQMQLEAYLWNKAKPLKDQSHEELEATLQVLLWLDGIVDGLPDIDDVRTLLAWREFTAPFERLAGDGIFRGRARELDELRRYVGVLPPQTLLGHVRNAFSAAFEWIAEPARPGLSVSGPGGVGKSALIARFILEHSRLPPEFKIPFAYLDFDRATLNVAEPATLVDEMLRQLGLQFPDVPEFARLRQSLTKERVESTLREVLSTLHSRLGPRPYLVMLDTFEQVQYRGEQQARPLWRLFGALQKDWPFLRVVISGRAPVTTLMLADAMPATMTIGDLDTASAVMFVQSAGVKSREMAEAIVRQVGGVPLSLKLAAALLSKEPEADVNVKSRSWLRTADEVIQGQLYERILGQIGDQEVRRVAHPGLVLRRITPDVLLQVLREPCKLAIETLDDAQKLFARLRDEVSLVSGDDAEGAVVHRRDLREVMLKLLQEREPALAAEISRRAVEYYGGQTTTRALAEKTYHQLLLGEHVDKPIFDNLEVRASVQASIAELPIGSQQQLASYGFQVDDAILRKATTEQREASLAEEIEGMLAHREEGLSQARKRLSEAGRIRHDSPLWRARARVFFEGGDVDGAAEAIEQGLRLAIEANQSYRVLELVGDKAWQCEAAGRKAELAETLTTLADYASRHNDAAARVQCWLQQHRQGRSEIVEELRKRPERVAGLFRALRPRDLFGLLPATRGFWKAAAELDGYVFAELIVHSDSTFGDVSFDDSRLDDAVRRVVSEAYEVRPGGEQPWHNLAASLERLVAVWPYRNLHVHPPRAYSSAFAV